MVMFETNLLCLYDTCLVYLNQNLYKWTASVNIGPTNNNKLCENQVQTPPKRPSVSAGEDLFECESACVSVCDREG